MKISDSYVSVESVHVLSVNLSVIFAYEDLINIHHMIMVYLYFHMN